MPSIALVGLRDAQKKALRLADNKIALNAGWDVEILRLEMAEIGTLFAVVVVAIPSGIIAAAFTLKLHLCLITRKD